MLDASIESMTTLARNWWALVLRGIIAVIFGLVAWFWPGLALNTLILLFVVFALSAGILFIVAAVRSIEANLRWVPLLLEGLISIGAGLVALVWPDLAAKTFLYMIAVWAILSGVLEIAAAIRLRREIEGEWLLGLSGLAGIVFGIIAIARPQSGALAVLWLIGISAIFIGVMLIALGWRLRGLRPELEQAARARGSAQTSGLRSTGSGVSEAPTSGVTSQRMAASGTASSGAGVPSTDAPAGTAQAAAAGGLLGAAGVAASTRSDADAGDVSAVGDMSAEAPSYGDSIGDTAISGVSGQESLVEEAPPASLETDTEWIAPPADDESETLVAEEEFQPATTGQDGFESSGSLDDESEQELFEDERSAEDITGQVADASSGEWIDTDTSTMAPDEIAPTTAETDLTDALAPADQAVDGERSIADILDGPSSGTESSSEFFSPGVVAASDASAGVSASSGFGAPSEADATRSTIDVTETGMPFDASSVYGTEDGTIDDLSETAPAVASGDEAAQAVAYAESGETPSIYAAAEDVESGSAYAEVEADDVVAASADITEAASPNADTRDTSSAENGFVDTLTGESASGESTLIETELAGAEEPGIAETLMTDVQSGSDVVEDEPVAATAGDDSETGPFDASGVDVERAEIVEEPADEVAPASTSSTGLSRSEREFQELVASLPPEGSGWMPGDGTMVMPAGYPIKGNASSRIYHMPGGRSYRDTEPEIWFASPEDARSAGFRPRSGDPTELDWSLLEGAEIGEAMGIAQSRDVDGTPHDEPTSAVPVIDESTVDVTAADEPTVDVTAADKPTVDEPTVDEPTLDEPLSDEPTLDEPMLAGAGGAEPSPDEAPRTPFDELIASLPPAGTGWMPADGTSVMPAGFPIKGNASSGIYHMPGGRSYVNTIPEIWFATPDDARSAGFRPRSGDPTEIDWSLIEGAETGGAETGDAMGIAGSTGGDAVLGDTPSLLDADGIDEESDGAVSDTPAFPAGSDLTEPAEPWQPELVAEEPVGRNAPVGEASVASDVPVRKSAEEQRLARLLASLPPEGSGWTRGDGTATCPPEYSIKGNASSRIYHVVGGQSYDDTVPEICFATPDDAVSAGFRARKGDPEFTPPDA